MGSFYRPSNSRANYWDLISDSIRKANNCVVKFIVLGDFNTDIFNNPSQHLMDILNVHQLLQLTNSATRITESTSSCLDLIMTQSTHSDSHKSPPCSGHSVPCAYIRNTVIKNKPFKRIIYTYSKLDSDKICNLLTNVNWTNIIENNTIDLSAANFTDTFLEITKQCMQAKTIIVRQRDALWINDEIPFFYQYY